MTYNQNNTRKHPTVGSTTRVGVQGLQQKVPNVKLISDNTQPKSTVTFIKPLSIQPPSGGRDITEVEFKTHDN